MSKLNLILTAVRMQPVFVGKRGVQEWFMPVLNSGKSEFKMPILIKYENKAKMTECHQEISVFIGKSIGKLLKSHDELCAKYNEYINLKSENKQNK